MLETTEQGRAGWVSPYQHVSNSPTREAEKWKAAARVLCRDVDVLVGCLGPQEDMGDDESPTGVFRCPVCRYAAEEGQSIDHEEGCKARAVLGE